MMNDHHRPSSIRVSPRRVPRRGTALAVVLIAEIAVLTLILNTARHQHLAVDRVETVRAFYAAEAGTAMALRELVVNIDEDGDGTVGSISNDGNPDNDPSFGSAHVSVALSGSESNITLRSDGSSNSAYRRHDLVITGSSGATGNGLIVYRFSSVGDPTSVGDIDWDATPADTSTVTQLNSPEVDTTVAAWPGGPSSHWGQHFVGQITVSVGGTWTFYLESDDGSMMWVDGSIVVDNDGVHTMTTASGSVTLDAGTYDVEVKWFDRSGPQGLIASWSGPGVPAQTVIPPTAFSH